MSSNGVRSLTCNLCDADDYVVVFEASEAQINRIVRCNRCGLMYANPIAVLLDIETRKKWTPTAESHLAQNPFRLRKELLQVRDYRDTRSLLRKLLPHGQRLVEIGSGTGSLLNFFREDGWHVEGIDPWAEGCDYARTHYGITAHAKTLAEVAYPDASADAVLMMHVIEHLPSPKSELTEVYRIMRSGGCLVVETPRYDSLVFKLLGRRERSVSHDDHIFFFTTNTLQRLGERAGFVMESVAYVGRSLSWKRLFWNIGVMTKSAHTQQALMSLADRFGLENRSIYLNMRDMQRMVFRKPT